jgi:UDP-N-acetylglucosamine--N-acetylmuramyl-(pentapeptide) pyrophosphoryl-undecaprenol N-acetylglucosamine transferase
MEVDLVKRAGVPFTAIPAAGVAGVGARALPGNLLRLGRGFFAARRVLAKFRPDVVLFTGGYLAVPVALASRLPQFGRTRPRLLLYVPDIEPGLALKTVAPLADRIAVTADASRAYFSPRKQLTVTGYPIRPDLKPWDPQAAHQALGLCPDLPTLLVLGGSRGARGINRALVPHLPTLLPKMQVVHAAGQLDWPEIEQAQRKLTSESGLSPDVAARYHPYPFLHSEMGAALTVADLALSRAGASTLGELPRFGIPAILTPYPYAWRYQRVNARYLEDKGAAVMVEESQLPEKIAGLVLELIKDASRLQEMKQAMASLSRPEASDSIAGLLQDLARSVPKKDVRYG